MTGTWMRWLPDGHLMEDVPAPKVAETVVENDEDADSEDGERPLMGKLGHPGDSKTR